MEVKILPLVRFACCFILIWVVTATASETIVDEWPTTTQYLGFVDFEDATEGKIHIAVGGRYSLYHNGDLVGQEDSDAGVSVYDVSFSRKTNNFALVVEHDGMAGEYGFLFAVETGDSVEVHSAQDRSVPWLWTDFPLNNEADSKWMKLKYNRLERHEEDGDSVVWLPVQDGSLSTKLFGELVGLEAETKNGRYSFKSMAGFPGNMDTGTGSLQLRSLSGVNLAFNSYSGDPNLVDGDLNTSFNFRRGAAALLQSVETDLGRLFPINRVRVLTEPPSRGTFEEVSLRGYSVFVSKDGVDFIEAGSANGITNFRETNVTFETINARYVRLVVTDFSTRDASPRIGEMEVYGEGLSAEGIFTSPALDLGTNRSKNYESVKVFCEIPESTNLRLRYRSGDDGVDWGNWSPWQLSTETSLEIPEPRTRMQFQVFMESRDVLASPKLDSILVSYDSTEIPTSNSESWITPSTAPIGEDIDLTYRADIQIEEGDIGIEKLVILTQWPASVDWGSVSVSGLAELNMEKSYVTDDSLVVYFFPLINQSTEVEIPFRSRLLSAKHRFTSLLFAPGSENGLRSDARSSFNESDGEEYSLTVTAMNFDIPILEEVRAIPPIFTPNADNINDFASVVFTLGRVEDATLTLEIYTLAGDIVQSLTYHNVSAGRFGTTNEDKQIRWDGRNQEGKIVAAGIYLYRLAVNLDPDDSVVVGSIGVAW